MNAKNSVVDFAALKIQQTPNRFLMLPQGLKSRSRADAKSPLIAKSASDASRIWFQVLSEEPEVYLMRYDLINLQFDFIQRTGIFHFIDDITVQFFDRNHSSSTLAVYSRSRVGIYDFGMNRRRVKRWVSRVQQTAKQMTSLDNLPHLAEWVNRFPRKW